MRLLRATAASSVLFALAMAWNGILHFVILRHANEPLHRLQRTDLPHPLAVSLALTALVCVLFVWGYAHFARTGTLSEGSAYGFFVGLFAGVLVDLNQYILYPLPFTLVSKWFVGGVLEFTLYGAVVSRFFPLRRPAPAA
jgi:hypothetical protein